MKKELDKLTDYEDDNEVVYILEMIDIFKWINTVLTKDDGTDVEFVIMLWENFASMTIINNIYPSLSSLSLPQLCKHNTFCIICFIKANLRLILNLYYMKTQDNVSGIVN